MHVYECQFCKKSFEHRKKNKKFCSNDCRFASRVKTVTLTCQECNKEFTEPYRFRSKKYCNQQCMGKSYSKSMTEEKTNKICEWCNETFEVIQSRGSSARFCSYEHFHASTKTQQLKREIRNCLNCNKNFTPDRDQKFCSKKCCNSGEFNSNYGLTRDDRTVEQLRNYSKAAIKRAQKTKVFSRKFITGWYTSTKTGKSMFHRSSYELKAMQILDKDDNVISYENEPFPIPYGEKLEKNYLPDFLVYTIDKNILIEVKPKNLIGYGNNILKAEAAKAFCKKHKMIYETWTEKELQI